MNPSSKREVGRLGEDIAAKYLETRGFLIIARNYRKKWGELDLIAKKSGQLRFVEVKATVRNLSGGVVPYETYRLEDKVHPDKLKRMYRAIESYFAEKDINEEWSVDVVTVLIDKSQRMARCELIENVL